MRATTARLGDQANRPVGVQPGHLQRGKVVGDGDTPGDLALSRTQGGQAEQRAQQLLPHGLYVPPALTQVGILHRIENGPGLIGRPAGPPTPPRAPVPRPSVALPRQSPGYATSGGRR